MKNANLENFFDSLTEAEDSKSEPYSGNIEKETLSNSDFRKILYTGKHSQLVLMSLQKDEEIGKEVHENVDQFFRIEKGKAKFVLNEKDEHLASDGDAVIVPAGTYHNVINVGKDPLKLYTIYSPADHPANASHKTKAETAAAEGEEDKQMK